MYNWNSLLELIWRSEWERERDAEQGDTSNSIKNRCFNDFETCESIRIVRRQNRDSNEYMFTCIPSFLFLLSKAAQHGLALFFTCSWGQGLSGFVTYQTREVSRCSPLPVVFVGIKLPEFKKTISPSALNFQRRNSADIVYAQTATLHTN